jgi:hypothetical protein
VARLGAAAAGVKLGVQGGERVEHGEDYTTVRLRPVTSGVTCEKAVGVLE